MRAKNESNRLAKECIIIALIELMKTRDYNSITITDLTKKAGVSRMAYYRNYSSKEDIINTFANEVGASIHEKLASMFPRASVYDYFYELFTQLGAYNDLALTAYRGGLGELIHTQITKNMAQTFPPESDAPIDRYRHVYLAGAFYNIFIEWLERGRKEPVAEMARLCSSLACTGCHLSFPKGVKHYE